MSDLETFRDTRQLQHTSTSDTGQLQHTSTSNSKLKNIHILNRNSASSLIGHNVNEGE